MWTDDGDDIGFIDDSMVDLVAGDGEVTSTDIGFLDDSMVELIEDEPPRPAYRRNPRLELEDAETRVWIRPYAARRSVTLPRPRMLGARRRRIPWSSYPLR